MAKVLPTMAVSFKGDDTKSTVIINKSDFDEKIHVRQRRNLVDEATKKKAAEEEEASKKKAAEQVEADKKVEEERRALLTEEERQAEDVELEKNK